MNDAGDDTSYVSTSTTSRVFGCFPAMHMLQVFDSIIELKLRLY